MAISIGCTDMTSGCMKMASIGVDCRESGQVGVECKRAQIVDSLVTVK